MVGVEEFPHDAVIPSAPAENTSPIRMRKIRRRIFLIVDMWSVIGTVKPLTPRTPLDAHTVLRSFRNVVAVAG